MADTRNINAAGIVGVISAAVTTYYPIGGVPQGASTTEANVQITYRAAGTLSNLFVVVSANTITAASTYRTRKNIANGNQSVSVGSSATGIFEDTVNTDSVVAADEVNYQLVAGGTGTSISTMQLAITFSAMTNTVKKHSYASGGNGTSTASTTSYVPLEGGNAIGTLTTEPDIQYKSRIAGTLSNFFVHINSNARTTATTFRTRKNTANGAQSVSVGSTATGFFEDTTNTDTIAATDLINYSITTGTGTGTINPGETAVEFTTTGGTFAFLAASSSASATANAAATPVIPLSGNVVSGTEANLNNRPRFAFTAQNLQIKILTNTIAGAGTLDFRLNGANTALSASITALTTGYFEDTSNTVSVAATDLVNYRIAAGAGGTSMTYKLMAVTATVGSPPPPTAISFITYRPPWRS